MIEAVNLIITWLISVVIATAIGFFYAKNKYSGKKPSVTHTKKELSDIEIYDKRKKETEERNFWNYDGSEQKDSNA